MAQLLWKTEWRFLRNLKIELPATPCLGIYPDRTVIQKDTCMPILAAALFTIAKTWKQTKCPSTDEWIRTMWHISIYLSIYIYNGILVSHKNEIMPFAATWM